MSSTRLRTLNSYPEFRTNASINGIINFIVNGIPPAGLNARQLQRYNQKFGVNSGFVTRNNNQDLFYNPNANINLEVVRPVDRQNAIQQIYDDPQQGLGKGLSTFYHQIAMSYLNISKVLTDAFLRKQGDYLVGVVPRKLVNRPILVQVSNERWAMDLIHMTAYPQVGNANKQFIMTDIDFFSGKLWARGMNNQLNNLAHPTLRNALDSICNEAGTIPHIIQADQEFGRGDLRNWMNQQGITFIQTTSYTPVSNGKVERMNRTLRRKIKAGLVRNNNLIWYPHLQDYVININTQQSSRNHLTPNQLWTQGYNPLPPNFQLPPAVPLNDNMNIQQRKDYNQHYLHNRAVHALALGRPPNVFQVNEFVRIKLLVLNNVMRRHRENGMEWNKTAVHYTPEIYQVQRVIQPQANIPRRVEYILSNMAGNVLMSGVVPKRFFGNDLIRVPPQNVPTNILPQTVARALFLNRLR